MTTLHSHGGHRRRSGRKPLDGVARSVRRSISMSEAHWRHVERVGDGNASAGVRRLVDRDMTYEKDRALIHEAAEQIRAAAAKKKKAGERNRKR